MDADDVMTREAAEPDIVVRYGDHADAVIDLHLPVRPASGDTPPLPLVVLIHGGFWRNRFDRTHNRPLAEALAGQGFVVASPEYRRVGGSEEMAGGWPATVEDVGQAMEALPGLLAGLDLEVTTTTVVGHSAGGHLALWLANQPTPIDRVVALAPVGDLRAAAAQHVGDDAVQAFLGGEPGEVSDRYDAADPMTRLANPPACEVVIVHGADDEQVPVQNSRGLADAHGYLTLLELQGVEHFALIDPLSRAWPVVLAAVSGMAVDFG